VHTLIVAPNWIGDAVMAQPLLALLARNEPQARIDVLAPPQVAPVFAAMPEVAGIIEAPSLRGRLQLRERWQLARRLRAGGYQRCYVLPNSLKSALVPFMAGIRQRHGHLGESRYLLLNRIHHAGKARHTPMVEHYARLAALPGTPLPDGIPDPVLRVAPTQVRAARARLCIDLNAPLFLLCPGAEYGPAKRWPARHFGALAAEIANEWPEATIALLGSAKERPLATEIAALSGQTLRNLCGETSLTEALALIAGADAVVSNDSGLMHVAAALRRPQVAVFGSSDPGHTPPRSPRARIEWLHLECSPCFERECPLGHTDCLHRIAPARVFQSLLGALHSTITSDPP
jgi:heptosyltransferase-2